MRGAANPATGLRGIAQRIAAVVCAAAAFSVQAEPATASWPCMQGTYIQLSDANRSWTRQQWETLFTYLDALQIDSIVLQWSVADDQAYYATDRFNAHPVPAVEWILELAGAHRIAVMLGLHHRTNHWEQIAAAATQESYLRGQLEKDALIAGQLGAIAKASPAFRGWYVSEEIDDLNWVSADSSRTLHSYLLQITTLLRTLTPGAPIGISAFANADSAPDVVGRFWDHLLRDVRSLDILYFQDGIGVHKLSLDKLPAYYEAVRNATNANGKQLRPVVELFEQTGGPPVAAGPFVAVPAPSDRVRQQLGIAAHYAKRMTTFSIPEYLSPLGGAASAKAFEEARAGLASAGVRCTCDRSDLTRCGGS